MSSCASVELLPGAEQSCFNDSINSWFAPSLGLPPFVCSLELNEVHLAFPSVCPPSQILETINQNEKIKGKRKKNLPERATISLRERPRFWNLVTKVATVEFGPGMLFCAADLLALMLSPLPNSTFQKGPPDYKLFGKKRRKGQISNLVLKVRESSNLDKWMELFIRTSPNHRGYL